ncbi:MAG: type III-A CRISPR-associated protein Csm2 [Hungatella sp.]|nr:type III-A CRISPR-associated protein Csm2 [Hungatella sp.]
MDSFWEGYQKDLDDGYFRLIDNNKCLKPEFIVEYPEEIASRLQNKNRNKLSQLWKFYDHTIRLQDSLHQRGYSLEILKAELCELRPAVNYAMERETVTEDFKKFIDLNVKCINNNEDLSAFIKHFQSVIAYLPKEKPNRGSKP